MSNELTKSLTDLIDETLLELEELRKSRFSAQEIKIEGPGDGIAGKPSDGSLDAKKAEDDKDEDKDEDKDDEAKKAESCEKGEDDPADSEETKRKLKDLMNKKEDKDEDKKDDKKDDKEPHKDDEEHEKKEKEMAQKLLNMHKGEMKKSLEDSESLMKSYVESKIQPLEAKLNTIFDLVSKIADQPVAPKGATSYSAQPLLKSNEGSFETLSKAQVTNKLLDLKKSGTKVDSLDITKAELGQDLNNIIRKYEIS